MLGDYRPNRTFRGANVAWKSCRAYIVVCKCLATIGPYILFSNGEFRLQFLASILFVYVWRLSPITILGDFRLLQLSKYRGDIRRNTDIAYVIIHIRLRWRCCSWVFQRWLTLVCCALASARLVLRDLDVATTAHADTSSMQADAIASLIRTRWIFCIRF